MTSKVSKENAEHYVWGGSCDGWHLVKGQELSVIHERMPWNFWSFPSRRRVGIASTRSRQRDTKKA